MNLDRHIKFATGYDKMESKVFHGDVIIKIEQFQL